MALHENFSETKNAENNLEWLFALIKIDIVLESGYEKRGLVPFFLYTHFQI